MTNWIHLQGGGDENPAKCVGQECWEQSRIVELNGRQTKKKFQITQSRKEYKILLVPAHVGIIGNKVADRIDKNTTNKKDIMDILVSKGENRNDEELARKMGGGQQMLIIFQSL